MTNRERFQAVFGGEKPDRLPVVEWASWWTLTMERWQGEGAPAQTGPDTLQNYFGLDPLRQIWLRPRSRELPQPVSHGRRHFGRRETVRIDAVRLVQRSKHR